MNYLLNCMLLLVPIMAWNGIFSSQLPQAYSAEVFDRDIPSFITIGENVFRLFVFVLPILMPIRIDTENQRLGLWLFIIGVVLYFASWIAQMISPQSSWSLSALGFLAPAYAPLVWLVGIGLIGKEFYFASPYRSWMYIFFSVIFVGFHLSHAGAVYSRNFQ